ncbi:hypothetical protein CEXT_329701 [Caerostris extrusa]|uniref:Uncharacterized protein n=1 Tax=Caerostris extrusa TaxID=172846 RepID=A0AAV4T7W7_CAEEX|nr:hypothetical protein CEXT_329701 [Caerostris extrusa]
MESHPYRLPRRMETKIDGPERASGSTEFLLGALLWNGNHKCFLFDCWGLSLPLARDRLAGNGIPPYRLLRRMETKIDGPESLRVH